MNWETTAMPFSFITRLFACRCCFFIYIFFFPRENSVVFTFALRKRIQVRNPVLHSELQFLVWSVADSPCPNKPSLCLVI